MDSAKAVLSEDAVFPSSKQSLISDQGWKVYDSTAEKRMHLSELLSKLPEKTYASVDEVISALEPRAMSESNIHLGHLRLELQRVGRTLLPQR